VALWSLGTCPEGEQGAMVSSCPFSKLSGGLFEWFSDIFSCHDRLLPPEIEPNWNLQNHEPSQPFPLYRLITSGVSLQSLFSPELLQLWEDSFASLGFLKSPPGSNCCIFTMKPHCFPNLAVLCFGLALLFPRAGTSSLWTPCLYVNTLCSPCL
jgi:hypothetical protein